VRRRSHNGFGGSFSYTYAKSIDNAELGGTGQGRPLIAQDWLNLAAERGLSNFDQRHLFKIEAQYSTGMGLGGGTLLDGWRGAVLKGWTLTTQLTGGSGLPLNPVYPKTVAGTGVTGSIRPDYTGASVYAAPLGLFLNPAALSEPAPGQWGNAGRNSIVGPRQFAINGSIGRTLRLKEGVNADLRLDSNNAINHVTFPAWDTTITGRHFDLPTSANPMRTVQFVLRLRF
jgi:hypothetical protein